jgi:membrane protease YdiL (CAAX protease family)
MNSGGGSDLNTKSHHVSSQKPVLLAVLSIPVAIFVYFSSQILAIVLFGTYLRTTNQVDQFDTLLDGSVTAQFALSLLIDGLLVTQLFTYMRLVGTRIRDIGWRPPTLTDLGYALAGFAAYLPLYLGVLQAAQALVPALNVDQQQELGFSPANGNSELFLVFLSLVVLPPIIEEILFRGFLYGALKRGFSRIPAALVTSVIFAAAHLQLGSGNPPLWVAAIDTFVLSLVLVYLREKSKGLMAPIGLHMLKNSIAFIALFVVGA